MLKTAFALTLSVYMPFANAVMHRDDWRKSTVCSALMRGARSVQLRSVGPARAVVPADRQTLVSLRLQGQTDIEAFFRGVARASDDLMAESRAHRARPASISLPALAHYMRHSAQYSYSPLFAYFTGKLNLLMALFIFAVVDGYQPENLTEIATFTTGLAAAGFFDYPWRFAFSYDRGLPKLAKSYENFKKGEQPTLDYHREMFVSDEFLKSLGGKQIRSWADLDAENVREELPGAWRAIRYWGRERIGNNKVTVDIRVDRASETMDLLMTAPPLPQR